jgi:hydrogenase maturation factor
MSSANDSVQRGADACELCGDVAVAGTVLSIDASARTAVVALQCGTATVALDLVDARVGDTLLVHLGFAITRVEVA